VATALRCARQGFPPVALPVGRRGPRATSVPAVCLPRARPCSRCEPDSRFDALIDRVIFAKTRQELVAATKALDRVLLWNHYVVPQWTYNKERTLRWNRFGRPDKMPEFGAADFSSIWWWNGG
jgi:hypothetical protein